MSSFGTNLDIYSGPQNKVTLGKIILDFFNYF